MKQLLYIILLMAAQAAIAAQVYGEHSGFFDGVWTQTDYKFVLIEVVTIFTSVYFLYNTKGAENPDPWKVIATFVLSSFFVILVYQWAIESQISVWLAMVVAFAMGTFGIIIMTVAYERVPDLIARFFNDGYTWARNKFFPSNNKTE